MRVEDVMTRQVASVAPELSLKEVAHLLNEKGISGLPVCDAGGHVVGVVSEADILLKEQVPEDGGGGLLLAMFERDDDSIAKAAARTAGEAMTSPAVTVKPDVSVAEAARLMVERGVKRLPVVAGGELVGIVTRADLVRAFQRSDDEIRREISEDVLLRTMWISPEDLAVSVEEGIVSLGGEVGTRAESELVVAYVRRVPGVVDVRSELTWGADDRARRIESPELPPPR